jgi:hypothetical protein
MPAIRSLLGPGRRLLARHLSRLSATLETFAARLRAAVSAAVGETVSGLARETIRALLAEEPTVPAWSGRCVPEPPPPRPLWPRPEDPGEEPWFDAPDGSWPEEDDAEALPTPRADGASPPSRFPRAVAVGLHTTLGWLQRSVGRFPVVTAVAVGLLTAVATYTGGPLAAAAVGLAGSALQLLSLAEAIQTGAEALAACGCSGAAGR